MQRLIRLILQVLPLLFLAIGCANRGVPLGGPKDIDPPKVLMTNPSNKSVNYIPEEEIEITFDEFIVLKDVYQEMIVSPPLKEKATASVNNKSVIVKFPDKTDFNTTTYTINFGKSITDNNEGNILKDYEFIFSLKGYIDSLNVVGKIVSSYDLKPDKERFYIMLYNNLSDSAPIKEKPIFLSRADEEGNFSIHNIENGRYRIFALKDLNSNLIFDLPDEQIAFADSVIELAAEKLADDTIAMENKQLKPEITQKESSDVRKNIKPAAVDTVKTDTLVKPRKYTFRQELRFFKEIPKNQYLTNSMRNRPEMLLFTFNQTLADSLKIDLLNITASNNWYITDINETVDTLKFWLTDTSLVSKDSLLFKVTYPVYDSTGMLVSKTDTIYLNFRPKEVKIRDKKRKNDEETSSDEIKKPIKKLTLSNNIKNANSFDLNGKITLSSETPLNVISADKIKIFKIEDTLEIPLKDIKITDQSLYSFTLGLKPEETTQYKIFIPDSTVSDIYGAVNDTIIIPFRTQSEIYYGILTMHLQNIKGPAILQLMDEKENILREDLISGNQSVRYEYLHPKNYILKIIEDSNNNGKWDTGKYLLHLQPEKVFYYQQVVNVRSNWEMELNWEIPN